MSALDHGWQFSEEGVRSAIRQRLDGTAQNTDRRISDLPERPSTEEEVVEYLARLLRIVETSAYNAGRREIQQGIIKMLDLRHLV